MTTKSGAAAKEPLTSASRCGATPRHRPLCNPVALQVIEIVQGLELTPEAHLEVAFRTNDIQQVNQFITDGVGVLGSISYGSDGPRIRRR